MSFTPHEYLRHMLVETEFLITQTRTLTREQFLRDEVLRRAFTRSIEVIGEAAKQVPLEFHIRHAEFDWRVLAGMRDRLIHGYVAVDDEIVWKVAVHDAPVLQYKLEQILADAPDQA